MIDDDDSDDAFSLDDEAGLEAQRAPGLVVPLLSPGDTVAEYEERMRKARRLIDCLFVDTDESGAEYWADAQHAERWRVAMGWPEGRPPTVEEATAWQANRVAVAEYREWVRLYGPGAAS
ncbi:hypothetical protein HU230_0036800 [Bradyrhizobium quebecense]|uniref:Uncharacterized protein n=1 Tax=Bradyrhizobium quebecense TaxID=2748629 RepID=A0A973WYU7_9BRAD|nr:hypothetical protein [Bradyrhizobium quebecense]UGA43749.1 hypothetical protein HU230_0036800 [Bradyrhizobium quebecense]